MGVQNIQSRITIGDVAEALGISKTTVSRAISGKGRIGEETRNRVFAYIEENNYKPSTIAKGLAQSKTYNIGWAVPGDALMTDMPFFQRCMSGVGEIAAAHDYDVVVSMVYQDDISQLKRIVNNQKVDGVILGRTLMSDDRIDFLKESGMPFVVVGSCTDPEVTQIDNDHIRACKELTSILLMKDLNRITLIAGDMTHVVNQTRCQGYKDALREYNLPITSVSLHENADSVEEVAYAVEEAVSAGIECIVCSDDRICRIAVDKLHEDGIRIPDQVKVASFYNSAMLDQYQPPITSLEYDPKTLGATACKLLIDKIEGAEVAPKTMLGYQVSLKASTQVEFA
jgi:DNA-binding LacI/PurR family transcriptional regulator